MLLAGSGSIPAICHWVTCHFPYRNPPLDSSPSPPLLKNFPSHSAKSTLHSWERMASLPSESTHPSSLCCSFCFSRTTFGQPNVDLSLLWPPVALRGYSVHLDLIICCLALSSKQVSWISYQKVYRIWDLEGPQRWSILTPSFYKGGNWGPASLGYCSSPFSCCLICK